MNRAGQRGFSLIELLVGLVVGLIVVGAVTSFTVTMLRSNTQNIQSSRLTQDLRTAMSLVSREVRRAGYDAAAVSRLGVPSRAGLPSALSDYVTLQASNGCITYQYNRSAGNQFRAIRLRNGTLEMATSASAINGCNSGTWAPVSDPDVVNIQAMDVAETRQPFSAILQRQLVSGVTTVLAGCGVVRTLSLDIQGALARDNTISRTLHEDIKVRADPLKMITQDYTSDPTAAQLCDLRNSCLAAYGASVVDEDASCLSPAS